MSFFQFESHIYRGKHPAHGTTKRRFLDGALEAESKAYHPTDTNVDLLLRHACGRHVERDCLACQNWVTLPHVSCLPRLRLVLLIFLLPLLLSVPPVHETRFDGLPLLLLFQQLHFLLCELLEQHFLGLFQASFELGLFVAFFL